MVSALISGSSVPGARFSKAPETFRARKAIAKSRTLYNYDYRAVLFTYSYFEETFPSYKKFQAYTLLPFQIQMN